MPKPKSSQAAPGAWKIFSMGALVGPGMNSPFTIARRKQTNAALTSRQRRRRAVAPFHCSPASKLLCQNSGKISREAAKVKM